MNQPGINNSGTSHPSQMTAVVIATFIMVFVSLFPVLNLLNLICCAGIILGGAAGTYYYSRQLEKNGMFIQNKDGIMIGLLAGIISAILYVIFSTLIIMISKQNPVEMVYKMTDMYGFKMPPESEKMLKGVYDEYNQRGFSFLMIGIELFSRIITHCIFGPVGGLLVASIINKRRNAQ
jgi:uncharacterized protein (DUF697 family)